jgi:hypothetical protein
VPGKRRIEPLYDTYGYLPPEQAPAAAVRLPRPELPPGYSIDEDEDGEYAFPFYASSPTESSDGLIERTDAVAWCWSNFAVACPTWAKWIELASEELARAR